MTEQKFSRHHCLTNWKAAAAALVLSLVAPAGSQAAQGSGPISDFMTMDVCTRPDGSVDPGKVPGSVDCRSHRDIRPGEAPPYILQNFSAPGAACAGGQVTKINVPVQKGQATRITSTTLRGGCGADFSADELDGANGNGASIQWYDKGYGFIMGSYSPVALSTFESDLCAGNSRSSQRFFRGWVIGPSTVPALGGSGYGVFPSKLYTGKPGDIPTTCSTRYNRGLTTWSVGDVTYKSGRRFLSIISSHYARSNDAGTAPGEAMQMEQTYWSREFGLSRWEKWAREDWVHPRSKQPAPELARRTAAAGRCSRPALPAANISQNLQISELLPAKDVFSRVIKDPQTGESHTWYMTLCEDYTNAMPAAASGNLLAPLNNLADDIYWR